MKYVLGIDLGTSGTKTVLFDQDGRAAASCTVEYPMYQPRTAGPSRTPPTGTMLRWKPSARCS